ncbi:hypothetical protein D6833_09050 [Candidatus Parcubacteria bacterium]|nr:MAG: hypothetical protein D6833_09050 [Candidatus Parcubacteria bacterium]
MEQHSSPSAASVYALPAAIVLAGALIAGAVLYTGAHSSPPALTGNVAAVAGTASTGKAAGQRGAPQPTPSPGLDGLRKITKADHIRGSINAPVKIVEFSDMDCPFCARFHPTMQRVMQEYQGKVAWVYRHYPLDSLHPGARPAAEAAECVAEQKGNDGFWRYADKYFAARSSGQRPDLDKLAAEVGVNMDQFSKCRSSRKYAKRVQQDADNATASGARGTPYSVIVAPNGQKFQLSGAQPYEAVRRMIDAALKLTK